MATVKSATELKQLQDRVAELEKQLRELTALVAARPEPRRHWPDVPHTEEDEIAFHEGTQRVREYIRKEREADLRRVMAEYDRRHGRARKRPASKKKAGKDVPKTRRAG
jgi:hypothetical protein